MKNTSSHTLTSKRSFTLYDIIMRLHLPKQLYNNADAYLHYSNAILFYSVNALPVVSVILLRLLSVSPERVSLLFISDNKPASYLHIPDELPNAFEGVIERYCGVPP